MTDGRLLSTAIRKFDDVCRVGAKHLPDSFFSYARAPMCKCFAPTDARYVAVFPNRSTKHGLQATLASGSAVDAVRDIIDKAAPGMRKLGASVEDLVVIPKMLEKRQTQADFQLAYLEHHPDLLAFTHAFADVLKDLSAFERYLDMAPALPLIEPTDLDEVILEKIGRETNLFVLMTDPLIPTALLERRLRALESAGRISIETTPEDGTKCSRVKPLVAARRRTSSAE
ncbi:MAG: hypothetical protein Q7T82_09470 [Armatimonadota bacterium]|nr:hypothetical protein [Armatimonadota bacterium]